HHPVHRRAQRPARDYPAGRTADLGRSPGVAVHAEGHRPAPGVRATGGVAIDGTLLYESVRFTQELFVWPTRSIRSSASVHRSTCPMTSRWRSLLSRRPFATSAPTPRSAGRRATPSTRPPTSTGAPTPTCTSDGCMAGPVGP